MKPKMPLRNHILTMIVNFNAAENLDETNTDTHIDIVLNSLFDIFHCFIVDYQLHKMKMPLTNLMNELHYVRSIHKVKIGNAHAAIGSS